MGEASCQQGAFAGRKPPGIGHGLRALLGIRQPPRRRYHRQPGAEYAYDTFAEGRDIWGPSTAPYFAPLDVAGYNYKVARYAYDAEKYPDRVIYGSESYPALHC